MTSTTGQPAAWPACASLLESPTIKACEGLTPKASHVLSNGNGSGFLSEDSFERIVDHFDDQDAIPKAIEAVELGIQQFPYSSSLLVNFCMVVNFISNLQLCF